MKTLDEIKLAIGIITNNDAYQLDYAGPISGRSFGVCLRTLEKDGCAEDFLKALRWAKKGLYFYGEDRSCKLVNRYRLVFRWETGKPGLPDTVVDVESFMAFCSLTAAADNLASTLPEGFKTWIEEAVTEMFQGKRYFIYKKQPTGTGKGVRDTRREAVKSAFFAATDHHGYEVLMRAPITDPLWRESWVFDWDDLSEEDLWNLNVLPLTVRLHDVSEVGTEGKSTKVTLIGSMAEQKPDVTKDFSDAIAILCGNYAT